MSSQHVPDPLAAPSAPSYLVGLGVGGVVGGGHGRSSEGVLASREGGRRGLDEGRRVAEGVETPLLGQQLLVRHRVDVVREAERGAGDVS